MSNQVIEATAERLKTPKRPEMWLGIWFEDDCWFAGDPQMDRSRVEHFFDRHVRSGLRHIIHVEAER